MKVAIVHDWLTNYGGAERVVQVMMDMYPDADIFTLVYDRKKMAQFFPPEKVHTSKLQKIPGAVKLYTKMLALMPAAFEEFDFSGYDLVICSSSCCAKGVITPPRVPHIAYIHSPMRYAWDLYFDYQKRSGRLVRFFMRRQIPALRLWDYVSSQRIDTIVANSHYIARRIQKYWNRDAQVVYPPVSVDNRRPSGLPPEDFYVVFSRMVPYKRIDLAIEACRKTGRKLVVIGSGSEEKNLRAQAGTALSCGQIRFTGRIDDDAVTSCLQKCRALIFCAEEDFGIIPLEAQACGRPVIAFGRGGALETVSDGKTGIFFDRQEPEAVIAALDRFEQLEKDGAFATADIAAHAQRFSEARFKQDFAAAVAKCMNI